MRDTSDEEAVGPAGGRVADATAGDGSPAGDTGADNSPFILSYGSDRWASAAAGEPPLRSFHGAKGFAGRRARHLKLKSEAEVEPKPDEAVASLPDDHPQGGSKKLALGGGALLLLLASAAVMMVPRDGGLAPAGAGVDDRSLQGAGADRADGPVSPELAAAAAALSASDHQPLTMEPMPAVDERAFAVPSLGQLVTDARPVAPASDGTIVTGGDPLAASPPTPAESSQPVAEAAAPAADEAPAPAVQPAAPAATPPAVAPTAAPPVASPPQAGASRQPPRVATPARWISGRIANTDNPYGRLQGTLSVSFVVGSDGSVSNCRPIVSSGKAALDAATCGLVERRLRFSPALDERGQAVASEIRTSYSWGKKRRR